MNKLYIKKVANQIMKESYHKGDRVLIQDPDSKAHFWGTIKKIIGDKIKLLSDRTDKEIEVPFNLIIASKDDKK